MSPCFSLKRNHFALRVQKVVQFIFYAASYTMSGMSENGNRRFDFIGVKSLATKVLCALNLNIPLNGALGFTFVSINHSHLFLHDPSE